MQFQFEGREAGSHKNILASVSIVFGTGPLEGLQLSGFTIWKSKHVDGDPFISFPGKQSPNSGHFYWFLRAVNKDDEAPVYMLRQRILEQYREWAAEHGI